MAAPGRRATIIDVAQLAGVSRQTVTRAVNDMPGISSSTRQRVLDAAQQLNYRPSHFGRGLVEQGPTALGVAVRDLSNTYFAELGAALVRAAAPRGWNVVLTETDHAPDPEHAARELARKVDALVGYGVATGQLRGAVGMPVVELGDSDDIGRDRGVVELATAPALDALVTHLRDAGVQRPVVVDLVEGEIDGETEGTRDAEIDTGSTAVTAADHAPAHRARRLVNALAPLSADGSVPCLPARARTGHGDLVDRVLAEQADALIAFNDELAVRLLRTLRGRGIDVPGRIRVVGIDGLEISSLVSPTLTTLAIDLMEVAEQTVELVAGMLEGTIPLTGPEAHRIVPFELLRRESA
ncbi:MAG TPA: LacI family transcriptional regulator [Candidatus Brachybacterium merdigallinarum]|nr:LacI family transcriptional regulator [Candidatus Brachybacterium merdigallinarum]